MGLFGGEDPRETAIAWLFVVVQLALLLVIFLLPSGDAWTVPPGLDLAAFALEIAGAVLLLGGLVNLGPSLTPLPTPVPHGRLRERGLYRWVRHPIYAGIMALVVGVSIRAASVPTAIASAALIGWFVVKARWEEARLARRYPGYVEYAARTPRFVPGWPVRPVPRTG
ncbi:MAG: NnrU family protein [Acidimicrobiales bacterium]